MEMKHVMIDLETLGTSADSVFLSLAAVQFDLKGNTGAEFSMNVELESAIRAGRTISSSTLQWWLTQRADIMKKIVDSLAPLVRVLEGLSRFFALNQLIYPWGNSAGFDLGMTADAYTKAGLALPWRYSNERCYRTAWGLTNLKHTTKSEYAHDPIIDCHYQIGELARLKLGV